ncbi:MAG TPA: menaquinone biosynthesis protein [Saprospiraceae bacterium]|nr:menaquinone biosynthesis protein [Saprospiraceae bacterium]
MKYRIALVEYLNTMPFSEGLKLSGLEDQMEVHRVTPAECAALFQQDKVDISLCPIGALEDMPPHEVVSDFCIGADGDVESVMLLSHVPIHKIEKVRLDEHSKTSNKLVQILADRYWQTNWKFYFDANEKQPLSCVMIGDKVFDHKKSYPFRNDLAGEWKAMTGLPMTFAVWIAKPGVPIEVIQQLDAAFKLGIDYIKSPETILPAWQKKYLLNNISYSFDRRKKEAMQLFLQYADSLVSASST